jgi:gliding motility-associated-like protein
VSTLIVSYFASLHPKYPLCMKNFILAFLLTFSFSYSAFGAHIIGGVITYECLDNGLYEFTMKVYRDCAGGGAGFDFGAAVSIYKGNSQVPLATLFTSPQTITDVDPDISDPCLIVPPGVCVEEGIYTFQYLFTDWPANESYTIAYQRCCRNNTITNLFQPGGTGATFSVEITPASQDLCNNSPTFDDFPPVVICVNQPLDYLHSATDPEGDQLIYELCAPLNGGGLDGTAGNPGDPNGCNGVIPNPACPPPYDPVSYIPPYNPLNPLGGNPQISIDAVTGQLSGVPTLTGQFVVGVCVNEFRNGQLLSTIRRDFQFNVSTCDPVVFADIQADSILGDQYFLLEACPSEEITFINESIINTGLDDILWTFDIGDSTFVYDDFEPTVPFPGAGNYDGQLLINPGSACGDTADILVAIYPDLESSFTFDYDTCVSGPVFFTDASVADAGTITNWDWDLGDGTLETLSDVTHIYSEPDNWEVSLTVEDINGCIDDTTQVVPYFPIPNLIVISPNDVVSCPPASITFNNLSNPINEDYTVNWNFGDSSTAVAISPVHVYQDSGLFTVSLEIISPLGCVTDTVFNNLIEIKPAPIAAFDYTPKFLSNLQPEVTFLDLSSNAIAWTYFDDGERIGPGPDLTYVFPDTGLHVISQAVFHPEGCTDTAQLVIDVIPEVRYYLPNAFTPNYDDVNDFFGGTGVLLGITDFQMMVWDRWGGVVFQTTDPTEYWNGRYLNNGRLIPDGVYVYTVSFTGPRGAPFEYKGFITLMR